MEPLLRDWAGQERRFALPLGCILDLEEARGNTGLGAIFLRVTRQTYHVADLYHILKQGLIGGGMEADAAKRLVDAQFDMKPISHHVETALEILLARVAGMEPVEGEPAGDPEQPLDKGQIFQSLVSLGLSPQEIRAMRYDDYVALCRAAGAKADDAPSEDEYAKMVADWEARQAAQEASAP